MNERTRPWNLRDQLAVTFYGAPLHFATLIMLDIARFSGMGIRLANRLSRANNRFIDTFRPGGRRVIPNTEHREP